MGKIAGAGGSCGVGPHRDGTRLRRERWAQSGLARPEPKIGDRAIGVDIDIDVAEAVLLTESRDEAVMEFVDSESAGKNEGLASQCRFYIGINGVVRVEVSDFFGDIDSDNSADRLDEA